MNRDLTLHPSHDSLLTFSHFLIFFLLKLWCSDRLLLASSHVFRVRQRVEPRSSSSHSLGVATVISSTRSISTSIVHQVDPVDDFARSIISSGIYRPKFVSLLLISTSSSPVLEFHPMILVTQRHRWLLESVPIINHRKIWLQFLLSLYRSSNL